MKRRLWKILMTGNRDGEQRQGTETGNRDRERRQGTETENGDREQRQRTEAGNGDRDEEQQSVTFIRNNEGELVRRDIAGRQGEEKRLKEF